MTTSRTDAPLPGGAIILVGAPGAGCSSVGRALARKRGTAFADLGEVVADQLGTSPELALVAVPEAQYRAVEATAAVALLQEASRLGGVVALGSGCLEAPEAVHALEAVRAQGAVVIALTATGRRLATRNGLDAPRSVALGNVHHEFIQMLRLREERCRALADRVVDTTETTPEEAAGLVLEP